MKLLLQLSANQSKSLLAVIFLSMVSALLTVGVIAFIQYKLLSQAQLTLDILWQFFLLLAVLLVTATVAQMALHKLGHQFVFNKRCQLIKQLINTDIEQIERIGSARLLASLSTDIRNVTFAFVHLPELIYGIVLCFLALGYLAFLSPALFAVSISLLAFTGILGFGLVNKIAYHITQVREFDDKLYQDYQSFIEGRKELSLNPGRAKRYFNDEFKENAQTYRNQVTRADVLNGFAANIANVIVLALIGLNYYLALGLNWATFDVASSFALIILFMRTPLMSAVGSIPTLVTANISMQKLENLSLSANDSLDDQPTETSTFSQLRLQQVVYEYPADGDDQPFQVGPIDFSVNKGEILFIIGGNGSGKSTFANLLTGLYRPHSGQFFLNEKAIALDKWQDYRRQFSAVFSDFYLFHQITDGDGNNIDNAKIDEWMSLLEMTHKVSHQDGYLSDTRYSQGQRKRLALLMAVSEKRGCLLLDEWAADQDPTFRRTFYEDLLPLLKARGVTVIAITHDDKYFAAADKIFKMDLGQLCEISIANQANSTQRKPSQVLL
ncbi:multidrug ABC transporter permease/ATP-binding protein [Marinomonas sp. THO17]|uniref:multidrug ABC transporter permease/ATP-binding protein n=1 Tax=Marinomonas sp. THO17 TaxID=3149048 RepID=UPI00336C22C4